MTQTANANPYTKPSKRFTGYKFSTNNLQRANCGNGV